MSTNKEHLHHLIDELPEALTGAVLDFVAFVRMRHGLAVTPTPEDRAWLESDLSRMGEVEPYDWGPGGEPAGRPVRWDAARGEFVDAGE